MPIIQRREHLAKNIEQLIITRLARDSTPVSFILLLPVDTPYFEKWIPVVKGHPKLFEILFGVAIEHAIPLPALSCISNATSKCNSLLRAASPCKGEMFIARVELLSASAL